MLNWLTRIHHVCVWWGWMFMTLINEWKCNSKPSNKSAVDLCYFNVSEMLNWDMSCGGYSRAEILLKCKIIWTQTRPHFMPFSSLQCFFFLLCVFKFTCMYIKKHEHACMSTSNKKVLAVINMLSVWHDVMKCTTFTQRTLGETEKGAWLVEMAYHSKGVRECDGLGRSALFSSKPAVFAAR